MATRLADRGLLEKSLSYLEQISATVLQNPSTITSVPIDKLYELADKLKYYDPVGDADDGDLDKTRTESSWLNQLERLHNDFTVNLNC